MFQPAAHGVDGETEARVSTMVVCRTAREARRGRGKSLDWVDVLGPFPRKSTALFH